jgi:hypothetical protein
MPRTYARMTSHITVGKPAHMAAKMKIMQFRKTWAALYATVRQYDLSCMT